MYHVRRSTYRENSGASYGGTSIAALRFCPYWTTSVSEDNQPHTYLQDRCRGLSKSHTQDNNCQTLPTHYYLSDCDKVQRLISGWIFVLCLYKVIDCCRFTNTELSLKAPLNFSEIMEHKGRTNHDLSKPGEMGVIGKS